MKWFDTISRNERIWSDVSQTKTPDLDKANLDTIYARKEGKVENMQYI